MQIIEISITICLKWLRIGLRFEDSPISTLSDKVLKLIRRSRFTGPTGPLIGCILLSLNLAFQEHLVRGDPLSICSSHIEITSASGPRHVGKYASWLRMVETLVDGWKKSPAAHVLDVRIFSAGFWRSLSSLNVLGASCPKIPTDFGVTG